MIDFLASNEGNISILVLAGIALALMLKDSNYLPTPWYNHLGKFLLGGIIALGGLALYFTGLWSFALLQVLFAIILMWHGSLGLSKWGARFWQSFRWRRRIVKK